MDEPWKHAGHKRTNTVSLHLHERLRMGKFRGRRYIRGHRGLGGEGNGELLLNGYRISIWGDKKVLEINVGDI